MVRGLRLWLILAGFAVLCGAQDSAAQTAGDLSGLWRAERSFGPAARGRLIVERTRTGYVADMAGRRLDIAAANGRLTFSLPNNQGRFEGRIERDGAIAGHWYPPGTRTSGGAFVFASPVRLARSREGRWEGDVRPIEDRFTIYLNLEQREDGVLGAVLRNPERNLDAFYHVDRLERRGEALTLIGARNGAERTVATGAYDAENDTFKLVIPGRGGSFDFYRDGDQSDFYPRGRHSARYRYAPPPA